MSEAMLSFLELVKEAAPYALSWALGIKAFRFLVNALSGGNAKL